MLTPQERPVVIIIFTRVFVRPSSLRPSQNFKITAGREAWLAEWIIDDSCLVHVNITLFRNLYFYSMLQPPDLYMNLHFKIGDGFLTLNTTMHKVICTYNKLF